MWEEENPWVFLMEEGAALLMLYFSLKCSELTMIYGGVFVGMYLLLLMVNRKWKKAGFYGISMLSISIWYLSTKTELLDILFHPSKYTSSSYAKSFTTRNVLKATPETVLYWLNNYCYWFGEYLFGTRKNVILVMCIVTILYLWNRRDRLFQDPLLPLVLAMLVTVVVHLLFAALSGLYLPRYICVVMTVFVIVLLYGLDRAVKDYPFKNLIHGLLCVFLITVFGKTYSRRNVEYLYENSRETLQRAQEYSDQDILFMGYDRSIHNAIYDSIYNAEDNIRMYFLEPSAQLSEEEMPDQFLIWTNKKSEPDFSEYLKEYEVEKIGYTEDSAIYHAKRRSANE
ncbi:MAG: hypothetical protein IIZ27_04600 [Solobacterium sp.]|nr:hypothetical protein [Solobacterium sp.]